MKKEKPIITLLGHIQGTEINGMKVDEIAMCAIAKNFYSKEDGKIMVHRYYPLSNDEGAKEYSTVYCEGTCAIFPVGEDGQGLFTVTPATDEEISRWRKAKGSLAASRRRCNSDALLRKFRWGSYLDYFHIPVTTEYPSK